MEYNEILKRFDTLREEAWQQASRLEVESIRLKQQFERYQAIAARKMTAYNRIKEKMESVRHVSWIQEVVVPLIDEVNRRTGLKFDASDLRAFGLRAECPVFHDDTDPETDLHHQCSLMFSPVFDNGHLTLLLDTGKKTGHYASDSIGAMNGFNNVTTIVNSVDDILTVLRGKYPDIQLKDSDNE